MRAGFIQFNPIFGEVEKNIDKAAALIDTCDAQLIVLPEFFNTGYLITSLEEAAALAENIPAGRTTEALLKIAARKRIHLVAGLIERDGDTLYNSAVIISTGGYLGKYRKIHLFSEEKLWFSPGDTELPVFDIGDAKIGVMICFDWFFPEAMRTLALRGADIVCHCANLVLPYCQDAMLTRCLENHVYAVTANRYGIENRGNKYLHYTGRSQITGPDANILYRAGAKKDEAGSAIIDVAAARNKKMSSYNDLFKDRRTEFYD